MAPSVKFFTIFFWLEASLVSVCQEKSYSFGFWHVLKVIFHSTLKCLHTVAETPVFVDQKCKYQKSVRIHRNSKSGAELDNREFCAYPKIFSLA